MSKRILVIGGGGFLGRVFCRRIAPSHHVIVCDSRARLERTELRGIQKTAFDFGQDEPDRIPCLPGDCVVIFSWRGYPAEHEKNPLAYLNLNLEHTLSLVQNLARRGAEDFLYASSGGAVYGDTCGGPVAETVTPEPIGFYGIGKLVAEMYVRKIVAETNARHLVFRIGNAYGPEQLADNLSVGFVARAVQAAHTGETLSIWGGGETRRDYVHARDVAEAIAQAMDSPQVKSGTYNVGSGMAWSGREIIDLVERTLGLAVRVENQASRHFDVQSICLDASALRAATGWSPSWTLPEGILDIYAALVGGGHKVRTSAVTHGI